MNPVKLCVKRNEIRLTTENIAAHTVTVGTFIEFYDCFMDKYGGKRKKSHQIWI